MNFGYIVADVASDSLMTDLAQREPIEKRGQLQSDYYMIRTIAGTFQFFTLYHPRSLIINFIHLFVNYFFCACGLPCGDQRAPLRSLYPLVSTRLSMAVRFVLAIGATRNLNLIFEMGLWLLCYCIFQVNSPGGSRCRRYQY